MSEFSTLFQPNDSDLISTNFTANYPHPDLDLPRKQNRWDDRYGSTIVLQWTPQQEVVQLPKPGFYAYAGKRLADVIISAFVIVFVLSWLIPVISVLILVKCQGPVFFIQARTGRRGKPFLCLKFRTMVHVPDKPKGFQQTDLNDQRVTALGRFLRRTNLDEIPQFINVLLGDMSLVGPRPHAVPHDAMHWDSPAYRERYWVRPGITGLAQVRGSRGATGMTQRMDHRVRYDHLYIPRQAFWLDMQICYRTLKLMYKGDANAR
ncbi:sugar transferase [Spirosoma validum]|uniref:Sugar transferase n=1 Tax=Spirosoma validum TaxID=2771355 RepID=A0A927GD91_9BACT|nr:sugar transferase [Spirosoma validum]MBD2753325.1 sugar transferase [Spirosoma validum]